MSVNQSFSKVSPERGCQKATQNGDDEHFWQFSGKFYTVLGVDSICLDLQDRFGWDVNLALYGLWLAAEQRRFVQAQLEKAVAFSTAWREARVAPLRRIRRELKPDAAEDSEIAAFREQVKALELEAERLQQARLQREAPCAAAADSGDFTERASAMLDALAEAQGLAQPPEARMLLRALIQHAEDFLHGEAAG